MRRVIGVIVLSMCLGQGCPGPAPSVKPGPTDVTDELRAACHRRTDAEIKAGLIAAQADHSAGFSRAAETSYVFPNCSGFGAEIAADCATCGLAEIDHVYSYYGE